ncbi:hypothetical protein [Pseudonocardia spinosispora]|uniref:hypothetical protein n=1 Tax=Pseudonocardia spinosispora TaxID=103441 RepID=UPI000429456D|nr:hypothetical protein [Pseudonocardia spinosispora]
MQVTTTARFGTHEVTGVVLLHRAWLPSPTPAATWINAPVPLTIEEVAAVLYDVFDTRQMHADDPTEARRWVAELVINGGCTAIEEAHFRATEARRSGRLDAAHWTACDRLARLAVAEPSNS